MTEPPAPVVVREVHDLEDLRGICALFDGIWGTAPDESLLTVDLLRALSHAGCYVVAAFAGADLVAATVGFCAPPPARTLHSHISGVARTWQGRHVGLLLKRHQRQWCLDREIATVTWTFDPLVRRNAWFNVMRLRARPVAYLENFYGAMASELNQGDESDRLLVEWRVDDPAVAAGLDGAAAEPPATAGAQPAIVAEVGTPHAVATSAAVVLVPTPPDVYGLRADDPAAARAWRVAVREALGGRLRRGATVTGVTRSGEFVVAEPAEEAAR